MSKKFHPFRPFVLGFLLTLAGGVTAATFNLFAPATGILVGNASSYITSAATSTNVTGLWSGSCDNTTYLRGDGTCNTPPGTTVGANPTGTIGLAAVNGSAGTYLRSDGAPALSQAIAPTWSANHIFSAGIRMDIPSSSVGLVLNRTGAATDAKRWLYQVTSGGSYTIVTQTDAGVSTKDALNIDRTGTAVSGFRFGNATDNPTYAFLGTGASTSANPWTWAGTHNFQGGVTRGGTTTTTSLGLAGGATPLLSLTDSAGGTDKKSVEIFNTAGTFRIQNINQAASTTRVIFEATPGTTGPAVGTINFGNATDNPTYSFLGTGAFSVASSAAQFSTTASGGFVVGAGTAGIAGLATFYQPNATSSTIVTRQDNQGNYPFAVYNAATSGDNFFTAFGTEGSFTQRGSITYNRAGNLTVYNTTSDERLKKNIRDADSVSSEIDAIHVRQFDWREKGHDHAPYGFIAQELYKVVPTAVTVGDERAGGENKTPWQVDDSKLVPLLVKEIQELRKRVAALEQQK